MDPDRPGLLTRSSLLCLFLVGMIGLIMRGAPFFDIILPYDHWLHTHSHLAMLGWVYLALLAGIRAHFLADLSSSRYGWLIGFTLFCLLGMAIAFPIQGYGAVSITFSSLFLLAHYGLIGFFIARNGWRSRSLSGAFLRAALLYLFFSSLFAWALGPIVAQGLKEEPVYRLTIYAYLHFQYNGWMSFALLGLLVRLLERADRPFNERKARIGFYSLHGACIPAYALSTLWMDPAWSVFLVAGLAALLQLFALLFLFPLLRQSSRLFPEGWRWPIGTAITAFTLKLFMQALSALPYFARTAMLERDLVIGYLHLVFLGFVCFGLFGIFLREGWLARNTPTKAGLLIFLIASILTEGAIFLRGTAGLWMKSAFSGLDELLFVFSTAFPLSAILMWKGLRDRTEHRSHP